MRGVLTVLAVFLFLQWGAASSARAVIAEHFVVDTTADLVELCTVAEGDEMATAAIHFCHGYLIGAYHYHVQLMSGPGKTPMFCFPDPPPSRDAAIGAMVVWAKDNTQHLSEEAVDTMLRWLIATYPCDG